MSDTHWYAEERELLNELRACVSTEQALEVPGYTEMTEIARGGQGIVYRAIQTGTGRAVAVKVLYEGATDVTERRRRFEREIELNSLLEHPNIARIYDGGVLSGGRLFIVMELVDGLPVDEFVGTHEPTTRELIQLFELICDAISHAHGRGVIHRDIKPSNILVSDDGQPRVLDFGIARSINSVGPDSTRTGDFLGTFAFASPEQVSATPAAIDVRTDVYSLGVVLFQLFTRQAPYPIDGPLASVVNSICKVQPPPASRCGSRSDRELDAIIGRALEKNRDDRYPTVTALAADLRRYQNGQPLQVMRHHKSYVLAKNVRRHWLSFLSAALAIGVLIGFTITITGLWKRAIAERDKTQQIKVFWEDTLGSVSSRQTGEQVSFREVLDEAVQWVEITTEGQPEVEASLRATIGNGYRNLGLHAKADHQLGRSLELRRRLFGDFHPDVIQSMNSIALLRQSEGKLADAETKFTEALHARERLLGHRHPDVAMSLQNLGRLAAEDGRWDRATSLFSRALSIRKDHRGADDPAVATILFDLGDLAMHRTEWGDAQRYHREALRIRQLCLSETHPDIARSLVALSRAYAADGATVEARTYAETALHLRRQSLPEDHHLVEDALRMVSELTSRAPTSNQ